MDIFLCWTTQLESSVGNICVCVYIASPPQWKSICHCCWCLPLYYPCLLLLLPTNVVYGLGSWQILVRHNLELTCSLTCLQHTFVPSHPGPTCPNSVGLHRKRYFLPNLGTTCLNYFSIHLVLVPQRKTHFLCAANIFLYMSRTKCNLFSKIGVPNIAKFKENLFVLIFSYRKLQI